MITKSKIEELNLVTLVEVGVNLKRSQNPIQAEH